MFKKKRPSPRRFPSLVFFITAAIGLFFLWFGISESVSGLLSGESGTTSAVGGMLEALTFGMSFIVTAWMLWWKPKFGAFLLILLGAVFGIWRLIAFNMDILIFALLVILPIASGLFELYRLGYLKKNASGTKKA